MDAFFCSSFPFFYFLSWGPDWTKFSTQADSCARDLHPSAPWGKIEPSLPPLEPVEHHGSMVLIGLWEPLNWAPQCLVVFFFQSSSCVCWVNILRPQGNKFVWSPPQIGTKRFFFVCGNCIFFFVWEL